MKTRTPGTKFSPDRELRKNFNRFLTDYQSQGLTTEEYVKLHCKANGWIKTTFIINGKEVVA